MTYLIIKFFSKVQKITVSCRAQAACIGDRRIGRCTAEDTASKWMVMKKTVEFLENSKFNTDYLCFFSTSQLDAVSSVVSIFRLFSAPYATFVRHDAVIFCGSEKNTFMLQKKESY